MTKIAYFGSVYRGHNVAPKKLIEKLQKDGYEVTYYIPSKYEDLALKLPAEVVYYPEDIAFKNLLDGKLSDFNTVSERLTFLTRITFDATKEILPWVVDEINSNNFNLVLYDNMAIWGYIAAQILYKSNACSNILMTINMSVIKEVGEGMVYLNPIPEVESILSSVDYPGNKIATFTDILTCGYNSNKILHTSRYFQYHAEYFSDDEYVFFSDRCSNELVPYKNFNEDKLTIFVSFGTIYNNDSQLFIDIINNIKFNNNVIVSTGGNKQVYAALSAIYIDNQNIKINLFLDQEDILSKVDIFVTHAGMNSATEAICHLVPMIAIPMVGDQHYIAKKLHQLEAGYYVKSSEVTNNIEGAFYDIVNNWESYQESLIKIRDSFNNQEEISKTMTKLGELVSYEEPSL